MNTSTAGLAAKIAGYREITTGPDAENHDGDTDVVYWLVTDAPARTFTPSEVAKLLKIATPEARRILDYLTAQGHIVSDDRGAWTRYSAPAWRR
jgi:transcription initiation factor IIE alpha subunit